MSDMPRCKNCRWWDSYGDPDTSRFGGCDRLEGNDDRPLEELSTDAVRIRLLYDYTGERVRTDEGDPASQSIATGRDFGCVLWEATPDV